MPKERPESNRVLGAMFDYLLQHHKTKKNEEAVRKWDVFFALFSLADEAADYDHFTDETAAAQVKANKALAATYLKAHGSGEFSTLLKQASELTAEKLKTAFEGLTWNTEYAARKNTLKIQHLKIHVIRDDYATVKQLLERHPGAWAQNAGNEQEHANARLLRKAVKNKNPQMLALLLKYGVPDKLDKYELSAEALAKGERGTQAQVNLMSLFNHKGVLGDSACLSVFQLMRTENRSIRTYPALFVIEDYLRLEWLRLATAEAYKQNPRYSHALTREKALDKFEIKLRQFIDILKLIKNNDQPQQALKTYVADHFKKEKENSAFRRAVKVLAVFNDDELKANINAFSDEHEQKYGQQFPATDKAWVDDLVHRVIAQIKENGEAAHQDQRAYTLEGWRPTKPD